MMRTEDDLRAAFDDLERHAPDAGAVLRAVYGRARGPARPRRSARRPGRRPIRAGLLLGAAVATAAGATAVAVTVTLASSPAARGGPAAVAPGGGAPAAGPALRARLLAALDTARSDILFAGGPSHDSGMWASPWYPRPGQQVRVRILGRNAAGVPAKDAEYIFAMPAGGGAASGYTDPIDWGGLTVTGTVLVVDHAAHTWGEWPHSSITFGLPLTPAGIRSEIARGQLRVIGRTELRGRPAIELGMSLTSAPGAAVHVTTARLWVNAGTYLPMRQALRFSDGKQDVTDYAFLPPTPANLANLSPVIPAGYHRTTQRPGHGPKK